METIFMNTKKSKTNKSHKFALNLLQSLKFENSDAHVDL